MKNNIDNSKLNKEITNKHIENEKLESDLNKKLDELGFIDWNQYPIDYLADYLEEKWMFQSSGEAYAINKLIEFYRENKKK